MQNNIVIRGSGLICINNVDCNATKGWLAFRLSVYESKKQDDRACGHVVIRGGRHFSDTSLYHWGDHSLLDTYSRNIKVNYSEEDLSWRKIAEELILQYQTMAGGCKS